MEHFARSMQLHSANDDKKDAIGKLSRVFCQILIRPPWDSIMYAFHINITIAAYKFYSCMEALSHDFVQLL